MKNQLSQINAAVYRSHETQQPQPVAGHTPEWVLLRDGTGSPLQYKAGMAYKVVLGRINYCMVYAPESEREAISELIASAPRLARENEALVAALKKAKSAIYEAINKRGPNLACAIHDIEAVLTSIEK